MFFHNLRDKGVKELETSVCVALCQAFAFADVFIHCRIHSSEVFLIKPFNNPQTRITIKNVKLCLSTVCPVKLI